MALVKPFIELGRNDAATAGGKGASLGEMTQAGIPVPPGFVILADAFEQFVKETDLNVEIDAALDSVNVKEMHTIERASEKIQALILKARMPADIAVEIQKFFKQLDTRYVAVRSSATAEDSASAAWAGQLDSFLNTTEEALLTNVQRCWASLFTPRAIFYRFEKELHTQKISVAVVVQKMVESECSGIAFSVHPVTEDYNQLIIEAGFGLGEAIVSGSVTPDSYVVEKDSRRIIDVNVSTQNRALYRAEAGGNEWRDIAEPRASSQVLTEPQISELSEVIVGIEKHYGFPCDIEWAYEKGKSFIVQSRPITTLKANNPPAKIPFSYFGQRHFNLFTLCFMPEAELAHEIYTEGGIKPYAIFVKDDTESQVDIFVNKGIHAFVAEKVSQALETDPDFIETLIRRVRHNYDSIQKDLRECRIFTQQDEFFSFVKKAKLVWTDYALIYWLIDIVDQEREGAFAKYLDEFMAFRKYADTFVPDFNILIEKNLLQWYSQDLVNFVRWQDIKDGVGEEVFKKRIKGYFTIDTELYLPEERKILDSYDLLKPTISGQESIIKGTTASPGHVEGVVRIVRTLDEVRGFPEGYVLVASMTTPDFMPAILKCIAIVTDEGGIVSHASIVSRELKKPCVMGTRTATQVLKDGDMVEVDADRGVVRILNLKKEPKPEGYLRMFAGKSFPFLFSDLFLGHYKALGVLSLQSEDSWMSLFPKARVAETLAEGARLYTSDEECKSYKSEFDEYIASSTQVFEQILEKEPLTSKDVHEFLNLVSRLFSYYSKTEFFYTDKIDQSKMVITIKEFDALKLEGRAYLNKIFFEGNGYIKSLIARIAKTKDLPESDLLNYGVDDLVQLVDADTRIDPVEVKERDTFFQSSERTLFGTGAYDILNEFFSAYRERAEVIHGTIANKGKFRGKARVLVPDAKDFDKIAHAVAEMREGEILIAETTSPDIIAACNKAAAIVTNQGGMLSHAAIVSRELGIPCVIGTDKDVILNIRTGDLVEVDADRGVVRIIK